MFYEQMRSAHTITEMSEMKMWTRPSLVPREARRMHDDRRTRLIHVLQSRVVLQERREYGKDKMEKATLEP